MNQCSTRTVLFDRRESQRILPFPCLDRTGHNHPRRCSNPMVRVRLELGCFCISGDVVSTPRLLSKDTQGSKATVNANVSSYVSRVIIKSSFALVVYLQRKYACRQGVNHNRDVNTVLKGENVVARSSFGRLVIRKQCQSECLPISINTAAIPAKLKMSLFGMGPYHF
jgi:hypothetical protein